MTYKEYWQLCKDHNWYYKMQDCSESYIKGLRNEDYLLKLSLGEPTLQELYNDFKGHYFSGSRYGTTKVDLPLKPE